jgi:hypothetical protein
MGWHFGATVWQWPGPSPYCVGEPRIITDAVTLGLPVQAETPPAESLTGRL